jgi:hypothetical protein
VLNQEYIQVFFPEQTVQRKLHRQGRDNRTIQKHLHTTNVRKGCEHHQTTSSGT